MFLFTAIETKRINLSLSRDILEKMNSNFIKNKIHHEADKTEISNAKKSFPNQIEAPKVFAESNNQSNLSGSCLPQSYLVLKEIANKLKKDFRKRAKIIKQLIKAC